MPGKMRLFLMISVIVVAMLSTSMAQDINYKQFKGEKINTQIETRLEEPYWKTYGSMFLERYIVVNGFTDNEFASNPESVLSQIYATTSRRELKELFSDDSKVRWKSYKSSFDFPTTIEDTARNFLLLRHKLTFKDGNDYLSIIKYDEYQDSAKVAERSIQIKGRDQNWVAVFKKEHEAIQQVIETITEEQFWSLYKKEALEEDDYPIPENVRVQVKDKDGTLNIIKLANYIDKNGWSF